MTRIISKKYANALFSTNGDIESYFSKLTQLTELLKNPKFSAIINSYEVSKSEKSTFVLSVIDNKDIKFENFIKFLSLKGKLSLISQIREEVRKYISSKSGTIDAILYCGQNLSDKEIDRVKLTISKKLAKKVNLNFVKNGVSGIKVEVPDLNIEIEFREDKIKSDMIDFILKAI
jgi:F-type H+-transporting ATPase subunit delta